MSASNPNAGLPNENERGTASRRGGAETAKGGRTSQPPVAALKGKKGRASATITNDDGPMSKSSHSSKAKHPNQYTYRNKDKDRIATLSAGSSMDPSGVAGMSSDHNSGQTGFPTPSPSKAARGRAAGARDSASRTGTPTPADSKFAASHPGAAWGMPEHLSHLSELLSGAVPENLTLNFPSTKGLPRTLVASAAASSAAKEREREKLAKEVVILENGETVWKRRFRDRASPQPFQMIAAVETSTKIRFPPKRMTLGEMRKRVRNIGEYVTRTQVEAVERGRRRARLGINMTTPKDGGLKDVVRKEGEKTGKKKKKGGKGKKGKGKQVEEEKPESNEEQVQEASKTDDVEMKEVSNPEGQAGTSAQETRSEGKGVTEPIESAEMKAAETSIGNGEENATTSTEAPNVVSTETEKATEDDNEDEDGGDDDEEGDDQEGEEMGKEVEQEDPTVLTMRLVEELTKELISFQQRFGANAMIPTQSVSVPVVAAETQAPIQSGTESALAAEQQIVDAAGA